MRKHLKLPALLATATLSLTLGFGGAAAPASASASVPASAQALAPAALTPAPQLAKKPAPPRNPKKLNVLVNKTYPLAPKEYAPKTSTIADTGIRLETRTAAAYRDLAKAARRDGVNIKLTSGYRSYKSQKTIFDNYTVWYGPEKARSLAAKPGTSEHQTGLSLDVGNFNRKCALNDCFATTPVGRWMGKNAPKYGFVLRYPKGQEAVTGYKYEPWHFRYVGATQARAMAKKKSKTLEHYYGVATLTKTTTTKVNLRRSATTDSDKLASVAKGTRVRLTGKASGVWFQVKVGTKTGWMSSQYLR
ncbi:D-alanyl-D-alanine carboxypeptidase family protein [Paeniglutamicibacter sp. NPDC091659]|uniref:D-alanyl-D-alanine carboxypeptidase family protein n=1 Tax=Paeniglutamicibacter sp. NPDC091659 TaxID=3364389 RepID=UPI0038233464